MKVSLVITSQVLTTLVHGLRHKPILFVALMCILMKIGILVHDKRWVLCIFKLVQPFVNLNISNGLILMSTIFIAHSGLWITANAWLSQPFEHVVLALSGSLASWRLSLDVLGIFLEIPSWFGSISCTSDGFLSDISVRSLIWIFAGGDSFLNLVTEFLIDDHRVMKAHINTVVHFLIVLWSMHYGLGCLGLVSDIFLIVAGASSCAAHITHSGGTIDNTWLWNSAALSVHQDLSFLHILWILIVWQLLKIWNISSVKFSLRILRHIGAWSSSIIRGTIHKVVVHHIVLKLLSLLGRSFRRNIPISRSTQETWSLIQEWERHLLLMLLLLLTGVVHESLLDCIGHIGRACVEV